MQLPQEVQHIIQTLHDAGFEAYAVGGCVRDLILNQKPKDWDVATSAKPDEIRTLFPKNFYTNRFGTVTILTGSGNPTLKEIEVTTYRIDADYSDQRHPDNVTFTSKIEEDLARRDFTINAMALNHVGSRATPSTKKHGVVIDNMEIIDPFGGLKDLDEKLIRAVGNPAERFAEDALRLMRAVRLASQLGQAPHLLPRQDGTEFTIEEKTLDAITHHAESITAVSHERVRDELTHIIMSNNPKLGMNLMQTTTLLAYTLPEVEEGVGTEQNKHHTLTVFEHSIQSLQYAARYGYPLPIRLAALFHDVGKPRTRRFDKKQGDYTFYAHDVVGARITQKLMKRLRFSNELTRKVAHLVRYHMFYYDVDKITEAGIRRLLRRVGPEHFDDLIKLRIAERKGSGVPKAKPYRLRHLQFMAEKVSKQPITVGQLKISGKELQKDLGLTPGPIFGGILNALLAEVLEDPRKNNRSYLLKRADELKSKDPDDLKALGAQAIDEEEKKQEDEIRRKYHV